MVPGRYEHSLGVQLRMSELRCGGGYPTTQIDNDNAFKMALKGLDGRSQRVIAAKFVEHVLSLCDDDCITKVLFIAANRDASRMDLAEAFKLAKSCAMRNCARYDCEGDWRRQAGYFVARAAMAALSPRCQMPEGIAWHAALNSRLARTSEAIDSGDTTDDQEREQQYQILNAVLTT